MNITFTAKQCRLVAEAIQYKVEPPITKLKFELREKVLDDLENDDEVIISTTPQVICILYPWINEITGEIDDVRTEMKQSLLGQVMANKSEDEENPNDWDELYRVLGSTIISLQEKAQRRIDTGKAYLESLR